MEGRYSLWTRILKATGVLSSLESEGAPMRCEISPTGAATNDDRGCCKDGPEKTLVLAAVPSLKVSEESVDAKNEGEDELEGNDMALAEAGDSEEDEPTRWWNELREQCGTVVNHPRFQLLVVILIVINGAMMGIATFTFVSENPPVASAFETVDLIFLIIFTAELMLQFMYHRLHLFTDGWLIFDFVIIILSWSLESMQIVRTFRVFRVFRLVTRVKILKNLVTALFSVAPRMTAIFMLLILVFYIYAVMCTVLFQDLFMNGDTEDDYFSSLDKTLWTLLIMMTLDWAGVSRQVMAVIPYAWLIFVSFVMITSFIAYNLIVAVVCDSVSIIETMSNEEEALEETEKCDNDDDDHKKACRIRELNQRVALLTKQQQVVLKMMQEVVQSIPKAERRLSSPS